MVDSALLLDSEEEEMLTESHGSMAGDRANDWETNHTV